MTVQLEIYKRLGLSETLRKLIFGGIEIPSYMVQYRTVLKYWHPHPPCLIPLFADYTNSYTGVLHHFFCDRKDTFVDYAFESHFFSEIARTEYQLFTLMVLKMILVKDNLTDEIVQFCERVNYDKINEVNEYSLQYGDDLSNPSTLVYYNQQRPFQYIKNLNEYDGDFPSSLTIINPEQIPNSCSFEIPEQHLDGYKDLPRWINKKENKRVLFDKFIDNNQLKDAWFTLNSSGWYLKDIPESLEILKSKSDDELLHLVADNWISKWREWKKTVSKNYML